MRWPLGTCRTCPGLFFDRDQDVRQRCAEALVPDPEDPFCTNGQIPAPPTTRLVSNARLVVVIAVTATHDHQVNLNQVDLVGVVVRLTVFARKR